jgi:chaperonin GroEL
VVVSTVRRLQSEQNNPNIGYEVIRNEYGDLFEWGIIDPAKVTRSAIENAASIASMILTTEALITEKPEEKAPAMPAMPGGMDY